MLLTACASMCSAVEGIVGPQVAEWVFIAIAAAAGWWKLRKVQATATAGIANANEQASKAKAEARAAHVQLARIEGSLRPAALTPSAGTSVSGHYEPVRITESKPRASLADPALTGVDPLPFPSHVPDFDTARTNPPERPSAKRTP